MLTEHGYTVGRYVSLEQAVAESADVYYQALLESTHGWHDGTADPWPWLSYFSNVIAAAYAVFADRAASAKARNQATAHPRAHPAPRASQIPPCRHQDGRARCQ